MSSAPPLLRKAGTSLPKETRITVLSALRHFYDEQIFTLLAKDFYNSDLEVSLAAIGASASLGNEAAIPHLYRILEGGKPQQKLAAVQTLSAINAPSSIEQLAKYFAVLPSVEIRREILRAVNKISAMHPTTKELNRAVLVDPAAAREYFEISLSGLLEPNIEVAAENEELLAEIRSQGSQQKRIAYKRGDLLIPRGQVDTLLDVYRIKECLAK